MAGQAALSHTSDLRALTAQIVIAHVAANKVPPEELPALINEVYAALAQAVTLVAKEVQHREPAVPIDLSIQPEYLVCLEDGAKLKRLSRYLRRFGLTPDAYRTKWNLSVDYPMVTPSAPPHGRA